MKINDNDHLFVEKDKQLLFKLLKEQEGIEDKIGELKEKYKTLLIEYYKEFLISYLGEETLLEIIEAMKNTREDLLYHFGFSEYLEPTELFGLDVRKYYKISNPLDEKLYGKKEVRQIFSNIKNHLSIKIDKEYPNFSDLAKLINKTDAGDRKDYIQKFNEFLIGDKIENLRVIADELLYYLYLRDNFLIQFIHQDKGIFGDINTLEQLKTLDKDWYNLLMSISSDDGDSGLGNLHRRRTPKEILEEAKNISKL